MAHGENVVRLTLIDEYLRTQREPTAIERFSKQHDRDQIHERFYRDLIPTQRPGAGEQFAFQVDLDRCTSCKACVTACHSMNGLDEGETWRFVGHLHGGTAQAPVQQSVTTACHHCVDPACLKGCPVEAYVKDPVTGIVKHLDDQCIGCQYCTMTCPYEVPQYSKSKGIVRKCDMCSDRLAAGEAPACVQACPNEAISIRIVSQAETQQNAEQAAFLPGAPAPTITAPTTRYVSDKSMPVNTLPVDYHALKPGHAHGPLVVMLVLTQLAVGAFALGMLLPAAARAQLALVALAACFAGLGAALLHLGRPLYAFRAVLGVRTSWMSREILAFGLFAKAALAYTALLWRNQLAALAGFSLPPLPAALEPGVGAAVLGSGALAVFCSVMIYHVTRKRFWTFTDTALKFYGTALKLGAAAALCAAVLAGAAPGLVAAFAGLTCASALGKLVHELAILRYLSSEPHDLMRSARLLAGTLRPALLARIVLAVAGGVLAPSVSVLSFGADHAVLAGLCAIAGACALLGGELLERSFFFSAVSAPRMPGALH
ncbi:MAG TPA: DmsC/YnfH family molybdoenzyme membrane anchor subunit [Polyangiales bacterium]|nr:DmsC/YnfH family molybdoenzyme membrane anchor subunit [Polyangiales bacterium]